MFSATLTESTAFGNTFRWAILSVLPMDSEVCGAAPRLRATDVNAALGLAPNARTATVQILKEMTRSGLIRRHECQVPGQKRPLVLYSRLMPLRKRERLMRLMGR